MRVNLEKRVEQALHEQWRGKKLRRLVGLFSLLGEPLPVDFEMYLEGVGHVRA